jgi:crotonobetainyl-CoA:carnitine CoA-transferase CaiB-like acyl-CoA transferase
MEGVRVLEVAAWTYVPSAGAVLAEWGADVIKIEHPDSGDPQRGLVTSGLVQASAKVNTMVELPNRGKRSVGLDLRSPEGHALLMELAATSDVFLTNFLPPARAALHIEVDDVRAANPDIIYVRGSGQGQRGPERERGGYDGSAFWARTIAEIAPKAHLGWPMRQPGPAFGDLIGGMAIAGGIAAALFHRQRTGQATVVDSSLLSTAMWAASATLLGASVNGFYEAPSADRTETPNPIVNSYRTIDGRFLALVMLQSDRYWPEFITAVGRPDLVDDPRFATAQARAANRADCIGVLDVIFGAQPMEHWRAVLKDIEGVWAPALRPDEVLEDPQVRANGYLRPITLDDGETFEIVMSPIQFDERVPDLKRAPEHGEHTDEVLLELGYTMEQLIDLKITGAVL